jgi:hypothetical protein
MSSAPTAPAHTRPPTFDRLALLELLGGFVITTVVFGIFTARLIAVPNEHGYTPQSLTIEFTTDAGIALASILGTVWIWVRTDRRPTQRQAMQVCRSGVLPDTLVERTLPLRNFKRQKKSPTRGGLPPTMD